MLNHGFGQNPNSHNYVQFLTIITMKNILLFSLIILSCISLTSCTADAIEDHIPNQAVTADGDTGGQTGPLTPPPPPTKP
jgi:hypothetical protein